MRRRAPAVQQPRLREQEAPEQTLASRRARGAAARRNASSSGRERPARVPSPPATTSVSNAPRSPIAAAFIVAPEELATEPADSASTLSAIGARAIAPAISKAAIGPAASSSWKSRR